MTFAKYNRNPAWWGSFTIPHFSLRSQSLQLLFTPIKAHLLFECIKVELLWVRGHKQRCGSFGRWQAFIILHAPGKKQFVWAAVMHLFVFPRVHRADLWLFKPRAALNQDSAEIRNGLDISYIFFYVEKLSYWSAVIRTKLLFSKRKKI